MKEYPNLEWFLVGLNLGTVLTLLATMYLTKTDDKPKYKHKKEYSLKQVKESGLSLQVDIDSIYRLIKNN